MACGVAPHRIEAAWTVSEFAEAMALQGFDPWGEARADTRAAIMTTAIVAALTGKRNLDGSMFHLGNLLRRFNASRQRQRSPRGQHASALASLAAMLPKEPPPAKKKRKP